MKFTNEGQGILYAFERMPDDERVVHLIKLQTIQLWQVPYIDRNINSMSEKFDLIRASVQKTVAFLEEIAEIEDMESV